MLDQLGLDFKWLLAVGGAGSVLPVLDTVAEGDVGDVENEPAAPL